MRILGFIGSVVKNVIGFVSVFIFAIGVIALFFVPPLGFILVNFGLTMLVTASIMNPPAFAFTQARRMTKTAWVLLGMVGSVIPPLGLIVCLLWMVLGRAVERAWAAGDASSYGRYKGSMRAINAQRAKQAELQATYERGRNDAKFGWGSAYQPDPEHQAEYRRGLNDGQ